LGGRWGPKGLERRRAERVWLDYPGAPVSVVGARLVNASPYGMMIESPVPMAPEAVLKLRLVVGMDREKCDVEARVAACTPLPGPRRAFGVGLEFKRIDERARARLAEALLLARGAAEGTSGGPGRGASKRA
jgi:hypothetical protein